MARPSYSAQQIRDIEGRIHAAALVRIARDGYRNFSLRSVARDMGLTPPALYRYVDNKDQLVNELRAEGFRRLASRFEAAAAVPADTRDRVTAMLRAYLDFAHEQPDLYRLMYEFDQGDAPAPQWVREVRQRAFDAALAIAREFIAERKATTDPLRLVHLWWSGLHGLAALDLAQQLDMGSPRDALIEPLIALLLEAGPGA